MQITITQSFFELQTPDFAWKFIWTVRTKYKSTKRYKSTKSTKVLITQPFFELQTPDFEWKFIWTSILDVYPLTCLQNKPKNLHESISFRYHLYLLTL